MKIVTITIKVEVPDDTNSVTVNEDGEVYVRKSNPERLELIGLWVSKGCDKVAIANWRETLTEVK